MLGDVLKLILVLIYVTDFTFGDTTLSPLDHSTYPVESHSNEYSTEGFIHPPRENVRSDSSSNISSTLNNYKTTEAFNPKTPLFETPMKNDGKPSVPKKGVENAAEASAFGDIQHAVPLESVSNGVSQNESFIHVNNNKKSEETGQNSKIVATLIVVSVFSVPLVALLFIGLYKVWSEWWQHRHYRRMDFLIEGMYNT